MKNKKCTKCGNFYPSTKEFFFENKMGKDGLESQCKNCVKKRRRSRYQNIIYEIYCIPTNTYYIGQTVKTLTERISEHFSDAKRGRSQPLYEDMRKYNREMFTYRILETIEDKDKLDSLERFYIRKYLDEGRQLYNREIGGRKGCKLIKNVPIPIIVCDAYGYIYGKFETKEEAFINVGKFNYNKLLNNTQLNDKNLLVFSEDVFSYDLYCHECKAYTYLEDFICNSNRKNTSKKNNNRRDTSGKNNPMYGRRGKDNPNSKVVYVVDNNELKRFNSTKEASDEYNFQVRAYARGECNHYYKKKDLYVYYEYNLPIDDTNVE